MAHKHCLCKSEKAFDNVDSQEFLWVYCCTCTHRESQTLDEYINGKNS